MQKIVILMLVLVSSNANADWTLVSSNDTQATYVDLATISVIGDKVRMSTLQDYQTAVTDDKKNLFLSSKSQIEYNCTKDTYIKLAYSLFSEHMGNGNIVFNDRNISNWKLILPETIDAALLKIACGKG